MLCGRYVNLSDTVLPVARLAHALKGANLVDALADSATWILCTLVNINTLPKLFPEALKHKQILNFKETFWHK